jgi:REP element-mobilizing transposase RayT
MARPLRLEFAGALYHVTSRGDGREDIYLGDKDREAFYAVLGEVCSRFNWCVHAECQMTNHYHLLVETPDANLSQGMRHLNGVYTQRFNRHHQRVGHVFQGRYKAIIVEKESYLLELARYIVLNPVRARMVHSAGDWSWSSYRATAGLMQAPEWLATDWLLAGFGSRRRAAIDRYRAFVEAGKGQPSSPWESLKNQIFLGSDVFVEGLQHNQTVDRDLSEIPAVQRRPVPKPLSYYAQRSESRDEAIITAYASGGFTQREIGQHFGVHQLTRVREQLFLIVVDIAL